jgi:hydroxymethylglutaryl-CoA lyase
MAVTGDTASSSLMGLWGGVDRPSTIRLTETLLRDGAQAMPQSALAYFSVHRKLAVIEELAALGVPDIEVASFAHPRVLPQFADADEIVARLPRNGATYRAVTPNLRGLERAARAGAPGLVSMIGMLTCSEEYERRNVGKSIDETISGLVTMLEYSRREGIRLIAGAGVAFQCPYEGSVAPDRVLSIVGQLAQIGFDEVWVGDTFGMASPPQVFDLMSALRSATPDVRFGLHLHNRHGLALSSFVAAVSAGITMFDTSLLGIGAGSVIPGARTEMGNVSTEEVSHLAESLGLQTGIDMDGLRELGLRLAEEAGLDARSRVLHTGIAGGSGSR